MIKFHLDKSVNLPFYDQIKGQLLSAIYCGKINAGDRLPSIRELAEALDVNYKTIRKIYLRLAQEHYIEIVKGSGAFLQKRVGEKTYDEMRRHAVFKLLQEVSGKARSLGVPAQKFVQLLEAYTSGTCLRQLHLAVIDHEEEAFIFSRELEARLGVQVSTVSLSETDQESAAEALRSSEYFLTTSWHMEEVRDLARHYGKETLEIKPSHEVYREILETARSHKVAIVIRDEQTMHAPWEVFMHIFYPSTEKDFWIAPIDREDLIEKIVREADLIFVSPMCWDEMRKRTPAQKTLKTFENFISEETIHHLRELQLLG